MKIIKITATYGRVFNLGNYNNVRIEASLEAEIEENDSVDSCFEELRAEARNQVATEYDRIAEADEQ